MHELVDRLRLVAAARADGRARGLRAAGTTRSRSPSTSSMRLPKRSRRRSNSSRASAMRSAKRSSTRSRARSKSSLPQPTGASIERGQREDDEAAGGHRRRHPRCGRRHTSRCVSAQRRRTRLDRPRSSAARRPPPPGRRAGRASIGVMQLDRDPRQLHHRDAHHRAVSAVVDVHARAGVHAATPAPHGRDRIPRNPDVDGRPVANPQALLVEQVREDPHACQHPHHPQQPPDAEDVDDEPHRVPRQQDVHHRQLDRGDKDEHREERADLLGVGARLDAGALAGHAARDPEKQAAPDADLEDDEPARERPRLAQHDHDGALRAGAAGDRARDATSTASAASSSALRAATITTTSVCTLMRSK